MLNMGGPSTVPEVQPFLTRLFTDPEIIPLGPVQNFVGTLMAKRRTPRVAADYEKIGGSPIRKWTELQGKGMVARLDARRPASAPHRAYIAFRYAAPLTEDCLAQLHADGVRRVVRACIRVLYYHTVADII
jgi:ferrochelatase